LPCLAALSTRTGTNNLLKQGACLVTGARDIVEALAPILGCPVEPFGPELSAPEERASPEPLSEIAQSERERIIGGPSPVDIDEVARVTGIAVRKMHNRLLELKSCRCTDNNLSH
jgi:DNA processing protein